MLLTSFFCHREHTLAASLCYTKRNVVNVTGAAHIAMSGDNSRPILESGVDGDRQPRRQVDHLLGHSWARSIPSTYASFFKTRGVCIAWFGGKRRGWQWRGYSYDYMHTYE